MNEVYARHVGDQPPARSTFEVAKLPPGLLVEIEAIALRVVDRTIEDFVRGLHLDAYLVGGAVRDELLGRESKDADFVVPGVDYEGLHAALEPHGKVEELEVAGRRVGARLHPRDPEAARSWRRPESSSRLRVPSAAPARAATTSRSSPTRSSRSRTTWAGATSR